MAQLKEREREAIGAASVHVRCHKVIPCGITLQAIYGMRSVHNGT